MDDTPPTEGGVFPTFTRLFKTVRDVAENRMELFLLELREERARLFVALLLAAVLCVEGLSPERAFCLISKGRGMQVPDTPEQAEWLARFATALPRC